MSKFAGPVEARDHVVPTAFPISSRIVRKENDFSSKWQIDGIQMSLHSHKLLNHFGNVLRQLADPHIPCEPRPKLETSSFVSQ